MTTSLSVWLFFAEIDSCLRRNDSPVDLKSTGYRIPIKTTVERNHTTDRLSTEDEAKRAPSEWMSQMQWRPCYFFNLIADTRKSKTNMSSLTGLGHKRFIPGAQTPVWAPAIPQNFVLHFRDDNLYAKRKSPVVSTHLSPLREKKWQVKKQ